MSERDAHPPPPPLPIFCSLASRYISGFRALLPRFFVATNECANPCIQHFVAGKDKRQMMAFRIIYFRDLDRVHTLFLFAKIWSCILSHGFLRTTVPNKNNVLCIALNSSPSFVRYIKHCTRPDGWSQKKFVEGRKFMGGKIGHAEEEGGGGREGKCQADAEDFAQKMHKR